MMCQVNGIMNEQGMKLSDLWMLLNEKLLTVVLFISYEYRSSVLG